MGVTRYIKGCDEIQVCGLAGAGHLWLLDPRAGLLEVFSLAAKEWLLRATFTGGDHVSAPPFDAILFPLGQLFPHDTPAKPETSNPPSKTRKTL